jgi:hypothetical protein
MKLTSARGWATGEKIGIHLGKISPPTWIAFATCDIYINAPPNAYCAPTNTETRMR